MKKLEEKLGYAFRDRSLLLHALTHSSYANEHRGTGLTSNERLEFLGDSVLGMVVADYLFRTHPDMPEGELTRTRAALVCEDSLHEVALALGLGSYLRLGKGEDAGGGRARPSILADATEATLAAVYLDGGLDPVRAIIQRFILDKEREKAVDRDYKTALQEWVQRTPGQPIAYLIASPCEAMKGLDAALKAADVEMKKFYGPPTETNFAGGLLTGEQSACKAACEAFAAQVCRIADTPVEE